MLRMVTLTLLNFSRYVSVIAVVFTFSHYKPVVTSSCHSNQSLYWADKLKQCAYSPPTIYPCSKFHEKTTCIFEAIAGSAYSHYKSMVTSSCHSNQSLYWADKLKKMCIISTLPSSIHVASFMRKEHVVFKLLQDPLFPIISQWKFHVAIATKVLVGLTK